MKIFHKIAIGLLMLLGGSIFGCKNETSPSPSSLKPASLTSESLKHISSPPVYGNVTTIRTGLNHFGPIAVDEALNFYYIPYTTGATDTSGIRKITPAGVVTLLAGGPLGIPIDGTGSNARFGVLDGITLGCDKVLYVTESHFGDVRKVTLNGAVTTFGPSFYFENGLGLKLSHDGDLFVGSGPVSNAITVIKPNGTYHNFAGDSFFGYKDGPAASAEFLWPRDLAIRHDSTVFVADWGNNAIRKIKKGIVSTYKTGIAGYSMLFDAHGNLYIGEATQITKISANGTVSILAGSSTQGAADGVGSAATFSGPLFLAIDRDVLYVADVGNSSIRKVVIK